VHQTGKHISDPPLQSGKKFFIYDNAHEHNPKKRAGKGEEKEKKKQNDAEYKNPLTLSRGLYKV